MKDKIIVILNSSGGKGKDTFVNFAKEILSEEKVYKISSADQTKVYARSMGWDGKKSPKDRWLLANLKSLQTEYNDGPFKYMLKKLACFKLHYPKKSIMFIDIREPDEIDKFVNYFYSPIYTCLITNDNVDDIKDNHADANVYDYNYDYIIDNSGSLEDLKLTTETFLREVFKNKL